MAFDEGLAERIREVLGDVPEVTERRMFGGLAFMEAGHMIVGVIGETLMARVGPTRDAEALARPHARPMTFTGRAMAGFVTVDPLGFEDDADLDWWVRVARAHASSLPPKDQAGAPPTRKRR
jgi:TfoX/Sxy family transcriptional regulator of competence genes